MSLFNRNNKPAAPTAAPAVSAAIPGIPVENLAVLALNTIKDGIIITDNGGTIKFMNPAAVAMTGCGASENAVNLDWGIILKMEALDGTALQGEANPVFVAVNKEQVVDSFVCKIVDPNGRRTAVSISVLPVMGDGGSHIITFRNVEKELEEDNEKSEFISTASHEMRTPVASIEGYLSLALNPQTATIDERAKGYLTSAHNASQHLGHLFRDLLDTTKLEDGRIRPNFAPIEVTSLLQQITSDYSVRASEAGITLSFGSSDQPAIGTAKLSQVIYGFVDPDFFREIVDNLIDNAIKYSPNGGSVNVAIKADSENFVISVSDTGIGISADDLQHIFQKFYRADNSDTRTIGGTGLGLYLTKQRVEAMNGRIWAESIISQGTKFYVSFPRLSSSEYEKRMIAFNNNMNNNINGGIQ